MKNNKLVTSLSRTANTVGLKIKKHSPELLMLGGVIGVGVSTVLACKATLKVTEVLEGAKETIDVIHQTVEIKDIEAEDGTIVTYTKEDATKDLAKVYISTGAELFKLYGPAVAFGTFGLTCFFSSCFSIS